MKTGFNNILYSLSEETSRALSDPAYPIENLLDRLRQLRHTIENLDRDWEDVPESLANDFDELDDRFALAIDEYIKVCTDLEDALLEGDEECVEDANRSLKKAQILLKAAEEAAHARFANWTSNPSLER